jgi:hypothetical protein
MDIFWILDRGGARRGPGQLFARDILRWPMGLETSYWRSFVLEAIFIHEKSPSLVPSILNSSNSTLDTFTSHSYNYVVLSRLR